MATLQTIDSDTFHKVLSRYCLMYGLEFHEEAEVQAAAGEEIGDGILMVGDIGHPIVGIDVVNA